MTRVVFPALLRGVHVYTGIGEIIPGLGIPQTDSGSPGAKEAVSRKPIGLPVWQVYLGVKETQPPIRFLQFIHKVETLRGPGALVYPTKLQRDRDRGVALMVPLGEGLATPPYEMSLAREVQAVFLNKVVRVIALGRVRPFTTKSPWSLSEHLLMEVFSEAGQLIWTNPVIGMGLEECLERLGNNEEFTLARPKHGPAVESRLNACHTSEACARIVLEAAFQAELMGDANLGSTLRAMGERMHRP
ncbi:MAG: hypothetical protein LWW79_06905 [Holophagaceae bacterium]|nr:hypothetical protein [Holophagaceae bacterium]